MFGLSFVNLIVPEQEFEVPSTFGVWQFQRSPAYDRLQQGVERGACANTFEARINFDVGARPDAEFNALLDEVIEAGLILSWLTARCVTVQQSTPDSEPMFVPTGDRFLPARGFIGYRALPRQGPLTEFFQPGLPHFQNLMRGRRMYLMLSHWLSGLTCFTMEDLYLNTCVQMDIVKQCEIAADGRSYDFYPGMERASRRYTLTPLDRDYTRMRNDLIHEGVLSGSRNRGKTKEQCAGYMADTLNWIDRYIAAVLTVGAHVDPAPRWHGGEIAGCLPSFSNPA